MSGRKTLMFLAIAVIASVFCLSLPVFAEDHWSGTWSSEWGDMHLAVKGNALTGTYTHKEGVLKGSLADEGKTIRGTWSQAPTHKPEKDAGAFVFIISSDGNSFTGKWWYGFDTSKKPDGTWSGTRK
ncbi:MAG: hypothetical protein LWY06_07155 [Firmicutes bacterium]|nr:hypothetical protein [Bacillota bacterium]